MILTLTRILETKTETLGVLTLDNKPCGVTLELPWKDNIQKESSIPKGTYPCRWVNNAKFGLHVTVKDVPGREGILMHVGNFPRDTHGCILVGLQLYAINSFSVMNSKDALIHLCTIMKKQPFDLVIK